MIISNKIPNSHIHVNHLPPVVLLNLPKVFKLHAVDKISKKTNHPPDLIHQVK